MRLSYSEEQEALRAELRGYFGALMTPELEDERARGDLSIDSYRGLVRRMGEDGWLGMAWPREYGGQGRTLMDAFVFFDESQRAGAPVPFLTTNTVGPTLMEHGSAEQRERYLPEILGGRLHFSIGYSEPGAGTDLANLRTEAVRDGDEWVINGQKMWTSLIQYADYVWLAARTDPDAPRHRGLSIFLVPTDTPGFSWTPVHTLGGGSTSATYYDNVRIPADSLVGALNGGWRLITQQLNHERVALSSPGLIERKLEDVRRWAQETKLTDGRRVVDQEWVRLNLARVHARLEALRLMNWRLAWGAEHGTLSPAEASAVKVYGSEFYVEAYRLLMEVLGQSSCLERGTPGALEADLQRAFRNTLVFTFGGGTNEVQRDIIATHGLGLPRAAR